MKELYYDRDYVYLVHGTCQEPSEINSFLEQGLINRFGPNLGATLSHIPSLEYYRECPNLQIPEMQDVDETNYLETYIRHYKHFLFSNEMNVIVKIPLKWFAEETKKPIWKIAEPGGWSGKNIDALIPELIYGFYLCKTDEFVFNKNYGKIESFEGLEYDDPWNCIAYLDPIEQERLEKLENTDENNLDTNDAIDQPMQKSKRNKVLSKILKLGDKGN